jgi:hypothetical protein
MYEANGDGDEDAPYEGDCCGGAPYEGDCCGGGAPNTVGGADRLVVVVSVLARGGAENTCFTSSTDDVRAGDLRDG